MGWAGRPVLMLDEGREVKSTTELILGRGGECLWRLLHQEIEWYRWSGIHEPPETRKKDKERRRKRKSLEQEDLREVWSWEGGE